MQLLLLFLLPLATAFVGPLGAPRFGFQRNCLSSESVEEVGFCPLLVVPRHYHPIKPNFLIFSVQAVNNAIVTKISDVSYGVSKYRFTGELTKASLDSYLDEYKEEMKRRKVRFPGFRPGKMPPYVMGDVRKYIVSYGLEIAHAQLCKSPISGS